MRTYLITGGCGFLGSNLAAAILARGDALIIMDNLSRLGSEQNLKWLQNKGTFTFYHGDIRSLTDIQFILRQHKPDTIFHLAGQVAMTTSIADPAKDFQTNALGTVNLLTTVNEYCRESTIIFSSTNKVYGGLTFTHDETRTRYVCTEHPTGYDEKITLDFHSPYGCSKGAADQYMLDFNRIYGLKTVVFRHSSICGTRQFCTYDQGWVGWFIHQAILTQKNKNHVFDISGTGKQVRDILFVPDLVRCYFLAEEKIDQCQGQAFNIGGGAENSLSLLELFEYLNHTFNIELNYQIQPWRQSDQKIFIANIDKAKKYFNWTPTMTKWQGLSQLIEWVKQSATSEI